MGHFTSDEVKIQIGHVVMEMTRKFSLPWPHEVSAYIPRAEIRRRTYREGHLACEEEMILNSLTIVHAPRHPPERPPLPGTKPLSPYPPTPPPPPKMPPLPEAPPAPPTGGPISPSSSPSEANPAFKDLKGGKTLQSQATPGFHSFCLPSGTFSKPGPNPKRPRVVLFFEAQEK